ncbi:hypothetical protein BOX15_Mlig024769g3, partial [Macrostomum lignano]
AVCSGFHDTACRLLLSFSEALQAECLLVAIRTASALCGLHTVRQLMLAIVQLRNIPGFSWELFKKVLKDICNNPELRNQVCKALVSACLRCGLWVQAQNYLKFIKDERIICICCADEVRLMLSQGQAKLAAKFIANIEKTLKHLIEHCLVAGVDLIYEQERLETAVQFFNSYQSPDADKYRFRVARFAIQFRLYQYAEGMVDSIRNCDIKDAVYQEIAEREIALWTSNEDVEFASKLSALIKKLSKYCNRKECFKRASLKAASLGLWTCLNEFALQYNDEAERFQDVMQQAIYSNQVDAVEPILKSSISAVNRVDFLCKLITRSLTHEFQDIFTLLRNIPTEANWIIEAEDFQRTLNNALVTKPNSHDFDRFCSRFSQSRLLKTFHACIERGYITLAHRMQPHLLEVHRTNSAGETALMLSAKFGRSDLILPLIEDGASVTQTNANGQTALSIACLHGKEKAVKMLLDLGSDVNHCDSAGRSCAQLAESAKHEVVLKLLCSWPNFDLSNYFVEKSAALTEALTQSGFTQDRVVCLPRMASFVSELASAITGEDMEIAGSTAEGYGMIPPCLDRMVSPDSDIDWLQIINGCVLLLEDFCSCLGQQNLGSPIEGHVPLSAPVGCQPAQTSPAKGVLPRMDFCCAFPVCTRDLSLLHPQPENLVRASRPGRTCELRISFNSQENRLVRGFYEVQGHLLMIIKHCFKNTPLKDYYKSYHAKSLLFHLIARHAESGESVWKPTNLARLFHEALGMAIEFLSASISKDVVMPHSMCPSAQLYIKNAGLGYGFEDSKKEAEISLKDLQKRTWAVFDPMLEFLRPLSSQEFRFHPFTLLPLQRVRQGALKTKRHQDSTVNLLANLYEKIWQTLTDLSNDGECPSVDRLIERLETLPKICHSAVCCLKIMAYCKSGRLDQADIVLSCLNGHKVQRGWQPTSVRDGIKWDNEADWAWRFCFPSKSGFQFPFLANFTQSLFTARLSEKSKTSHVYINFRCLFWSLQAELLGAGEVCVDDWYTEIQADADLEELLTLANYSDSHQHRNFCKEELKKLRKEGRVVLEDYDFKRPAAEHFFE